MGAPASSSTSTIGYDEERERLLLELEELVPTLEDDDDETLIGVEVVENEEPAGEIVRIRATAEQMFALARHGAAVCERGRPTCELCGNPKDPEGHTCPATNGHKKPTSIG